MEQMPGENNRIRLHKDVFDGIESIRVSGLTNMLDRTAVLKLAINWGLTQTADWIESVDRGTYGRLILEGADVIQPNDETLDERLDRLDREYDGERRSFWEGGEALEDHTPDSQIAQMHSTIRNLGRIASLTIADAYETERMGVLVDPSRLADINAERNRLMMNLTEASNLGRQLEEITKEIHRGIDAIQNMIDPERN